MKEIKITQLLTSKTYTLDRYFAEISRYPALSPEDEAILAKKAREGDVSAREKLIRCNLRFVITVAKKYQDYGVALGDLINDGNIGLIKAASKYDETKGFKFISFAVWEIRQSITHSLTKRRRLVRLPGNIIAGYTKVVQASLELEQQLERVPNLKEIADFTQLSEKHIFEFINTVSHPISLYKPSTQDQDSSTLLDQIPNIQSEAPDQEVLNHSLKTDLNRLINKLREREQQIIRLYYGMDMAYPMTLKDIASQMKMSQVTVQKIQARSIKTLKEYAKTDLKGYL
ncbi:RNA polymerase subunit sigma [Pedobacter sp. HMWF019]|uniref:sigma-70 family RNA polymerase sigma factor n=1 Tax=Pedobacter sp. HMWF019 TaxID=2056856 RepID=UPI000D39EA43|nr:RNA polymerase sigma factor RpoD/SigA [Pedobacter sp. HMWF019]PTS99358.1 RNA polymerase subunit sigma [Pedobacter sp. HMWF019]